MSDIKIEEGEFYAFINKMKYYIESSSGYVPEELKEAGAVLVKYIEQKQNIRGLMLERKTYYNFYINNRFSHQEEAAAAYKRYLDIKNKIKHIQEENDYE